MGSAWVQERERGGGRGQGVDAAGLSYLACGGCAGGGGGGREGRSALVQDAACLHLVLHCVSLSHISILLWGSPSIQKRLVGSRTLSLS
jgi:hypothetical protein